MTITISKCDKCAWCELPGGSHLFGRDVDEVKAALDSMAAAGAFRIYESPDVQVVLSDGKPRNLSYST